MFGNITTYFIGKELFILCRIYFSEQVLSLVFGDNGFAIRCKIIGVNHGIIVTSRGAGDNFGGLN